ncbi:hypothetical protein G7K_1655-t1 [Saitoella complicata NRRL Y-17804]|uniref:Ras-GEF domain-containing protein n=2 Tax=Saitoella complicata (strain BCRC 22490 / CBS 7301 / JCM 7358 / NBRC 10748 / NRRL Y-17804) TaxID=698492 RepID=A0A0E9NCC5_SAICN|nr:hypothetical protein G7K_1655-t1 [Saitoella complicata NRRL Y-17804]
MNFFGIDKPEWLQPKPKRMMSQQFGASKNSKARSQSTGGVLNDVTAGVNNSKPPTSRQPHARNPSIPSPKLGDESFAQSVSTTLASRGIKGFSQILGARRLARKSSALNLNLGNVSQGLSLRFSSSNPMVNIVPPNENALVVESNEPEKQRTPRAQSLPLNLITPAQANTLAGDPGSRNRKHLQIDVSLTKQQKAPPSIVDSASAVSVPRPSAEADFFTSPSSSGHSNLFSPLELQFDRPTATATTVPSLYAPSLHPSLEQARATSSTSLPLPQSTGQESSIGHGLLPGLAIAQAFAMPAGVLCNMQSEMDLRALKGLWARRRQPRKRLPFASGAGEGSAKDPAKVFSPPATPGPVPLSPAFSEMSVWEDDTDDESSYSEDEDGKLPKKLKAAGEFLRKQKSLPALFGRMNLQAKKSLEMLTARPGSRARPGSGVSFVVEEIKALGERDVLHVRNKAGADVLVLSCEDGKTWPAAGTAELVVSEMISPLGREPDEAYVDFIIKMYGLFMTDYQFLTLLTEHYHKSERSLAKWDREVMQKRMLKILETWIKTQPEKLIGCEETIQGLEEFCELARITHDKEIDKVWDLFEHEHGLAQKYEADVKAITVSLDSEFKASATMQTNTPYVSPLLALETNEIAKYLSALDYILYRDASQMTPLRAWWQKRRNGNDCDRNALATIDRIFARTAMVQHWVAVEVLGAVGVERRREVICKFIGVAKILKALNNFQSLICVVNGLTHPTVKKLGETWRLIPPAYTTLLDEYSCLAAEAHSLPASSAYRRSLAKAKSPTIPYFPFFSRDVSIFQDSEMSFLCPRNDKSLPRHHSIGSSQALSSFATSSILESQEMDPVMVNLQKFRKTYDVISRAQGYSSRPYAFQSNLGMNSYSLRLYVPGRNTMSKWSSSSEKLGPVPSTGPLDHVGEVVERTIIRAWTLSHSDAESSSVEEGRGKLLKELLGKCMETL